MRGEGRGERETNETTDNGSVPDDEKIFLTSFELEDDLRKAKKGERVRVAEDDEGEGEKTRHDSPAPVGLFEAKKIK